MPAPDAAPGAGSDDDDPRVELLAAREGDRRLGPGTSVLNAAGVAGTPGVVTAESETEALAAVTEILATHRVWDRFPATVS